MDEDWQIRGGRRDAGASQGLSAVHVALLFGAAATALALLVTPFVDGNGYRRFASTSGLDRMATGSVSRGGETYTIRRSVLQPTPNSVCVIHSSGVRRGEC